MLTLALLPRCAVLSCAVLVAGTERVFPSGLRGPDQWQGYDHCRPGEFM